MFKIFSYSGVGTVKARPWSETRGGPDQVRHRKLRFILCVFRSYAYRFKRQASLLYDTIGLVCMAVVFHLVCRKQKIPVPLTAVQITGTYCWMAKSSAECAFSDELIFWEVESCTGAIGGDALALSTPGPSLCREGLKPSGVTYGFKSSDTKKAPRRELCTHRYPRTCM